MNTQRRTWLAAALLVAAALAAYANSFRVPLLFDDQPSILQNPSILSWRTALSPPRGFGFTVSGRPLLNLSLAANYAAGGFDVRGYHALNLLIHAAAGLALLGLARRTLRRPVLAAAFGAQTELAAFALALAWTLHPLQTEAVTYIIQRAESLMALFFLLTLYCFARATESAQPRWWLVAAIGACALGMGCKEVMATAPLMVLLYDRTFVAGDFRTAWRSRRWFYAGLFATWLPLFWLVVFVGGDRGGTFAFTPTAIFGYWLAQFEALACYLKLALWPTPLVFDYGWFQVNRTAQVLPAVLLVVAGMGVTLGALRRRPVVGFFGAFFFIVLAPTSLMPGTIQIIVEHRMYLPLAAVLALVLGVANALAGRRGILVLIGGALAAGVLTARRNVDYRSDLALWGDTVAKRPGSAIAQGSLGTAYYRRGNFTAALRCYEAALRLNPAAAQEHFNAGLALDALGRRAEAIAQFTEAARLLPHFAQAHAQLGASLIAAGRAGDAIWHLQEALSFIPDLVEARNSLGLALAETGRVADSIVCYSAALRLRPDYAEAESNWGAAAFRLGRLDEARQHLARAIQLQPELVAAHFNLGLVAAAAGQADEARSHYTDVLRHDPVHAEARLNLGIALAQAGRLDEALAHLREAVRLRPALAETHANLGIVLAETGRLDEAIASYGEALRLRPDYARAHYNLGNTLAQQRRWAEARTHFAEAVRLEPDFAAARESLQRLDGAPRGR